MKKKLQFNTTLLHPHIKITKKCLLSQSQLLRVHVTHNEGAQRGQFLTPWSERNHSFILSKWSGAFPQNITFTPHEMCDQKKEFLPPLILTTSNKVATVLGITFLKRRRSHGR